MTALRHEPRRGGRLPAYPTRLQVLADPHLLRRHVPLTWRKRREIAGARGALLAANAGGCSDRTPGATGGTSTRPANISKPSAAIVAPIFAHGDGIGERFRPEIMGDFAGPAFAPAYLTEEVALQVVAEELRKAGLSISGAGITFSDVIIHGHEWYYGYEWVSVRWGSAFKDIDGPLETDLYDPQHHVAIEYVSETDFDRLGGKEEGQSWTKLIRMKDVAASVNERVHADGHGVYFGAFYDPAVYVRSGIWSPPDEPDRVRETVVKSKPAAGAEAKRLLRLQVQDFIDWLRAQGVI